MEKYHKTDISPIEKENERDETYEAQNPHIDSERTSNNYHTVRRDESYTEYINKRLEEKDIKPRKDAVLMCSFVISSDKTFFDSLTETEERKFFYDATTYFANKYGRENIISAVVHKDETTPHLHLNLMPLADERLCAKDLFCPKNLRILQTEFYEKVGKRYGLDRGKEGSQAKHLSTAEFKAKRIIEQAEEIKQEKQVYANALKEAESGEISNKKGKLKEQVIALIAENKRLENENSILINDNEDLFKEYQKAKSFEKQAKVAKEAMLAVRQYELEAYARTFFKATGIMQAFVDMFTAPIPLPRNHVREIENEVEFEKQQEKAKQAKENTSDYYWSK